MAKSSKKLLTHKGHFFVSIRRAGRQAGKQASGLLLSFLRDLDTFQLFKMLFQRDILKKNVILTSFKCGIASYIGLIKFPLRYFYNHYFLLIDVFLKPFQVRRAIPRACAHTRTSVCMCDKWHAQMKLLPTRFSYMIACVWSRYVALLNTLKTFLLVSLL